MMAGTEIAGPENPRRDGMSVAQALGTMIACALVLMTLMSLLPER